MSVPWVTINETGYTFMLPRNGTASVINFANHTVSVCRLKPDELTVLDRFQIQGGPTEDGYFYFIHAQPPDGALATIIQLSKDEADIVFPNFRREEGMYYMGN